MPVIANEKIEARIAEAVSKLVSTSIDGGRVRISLPVLYPSGAGSAVEIMINGEKCFVTDFGFGLMEAEMYGAEEFFDSAARKSAARFGVGFDGASVFALWADLSRLEGAIAGVANASVQAAGASIMRAVEEKEKRTNREVYERVVEYFGARSVVREQDLSGKEDVWTAHNVVIIPGRKKAVFEFVTDNANSIANKFIMYSDLSRIENTYSLNSVVRSIPSIGKRGSMLADVSNVLSLDSPRELYLRYAEAA